MQIFLQSDFVEMINQDGVTKAEVGLAFAKEGTHSCEPISVIPSRCETTLGPYLF